MRNTLVLGAAIIILAACLPAGVARAETRDLSLAEFRDHLKGGFVGQMVGVSYAAPYEFRFDGKTVPRWQLLPWRPSRLGNAIHQDDIYVELTFLRVMEQEGVNASAESLARAFGDSRYLLWHANLAARDNIRAGIMPPLSGHPKYNPHADDIDFQIEADYIGLICPGLPAAAQEIAWRAGHVMNYGDGVYGGVFIAAMYSAAFFERDPARVVEQGLAALPAESNYAKTIAEVLAAWRKDPRDWRTAWRVVEDKWAGKVHCPSASTAAPGKKLGIGANVNGAYVVIGLLYGHSDPAETLAIATMCGRDNDCNAASAMGVLGTMLGYEELGPRYGGGLAALRGRKFDFTAYDWQDALRVMEGRAAEVVAQKGGTAPAGDRGFSIPVLPLVALPLEQWAYDQPAEAVPLP